MKKIIILLLCCVLMLAGCGNDFPKPQDNRIRIVTTIFPLYDFARAVGGDKIELKMLIPPGTEVHSYDPKPSDIRAIYNSDIFFYIGGESDEWVKTLLSDINICPVEFINSVKTLDEYDPDGHSHTHGEHETDEHIWTSPANAATMIEIIADELCAADSENSELYRSNAERYINEISEIGNEVSRLVKRTPSPFILVADRFPFRYFTEEYGISYEAAFGGCADSADISLKAMKRLVDSVEKNGVTAAYYTEMSAKTIASALKEETGVRLLELQSGHTVTVKEFKSGITYAQLLRRNLRALEEGWNG